MDAGAIRELRPEPANSPGEGGPTLPRAPRTIGETGLGKELLEDLCAKHLLLRGRQSLRALAKMLRLPPSVVTEILHFMRGQRQVESAGHRGLEADAEYQLTDIGRAFAKDALMRCQYAGPAPVPLAAYCERVAAHSMRNVAIDAEYVHDALRGLVLMSDIVDQMGAAMNSGRAILVYGPAGSGKTYLAEQLGSLMPGNVAVPYAITVGGEIIQVFDPLVHEPIAAVIDDASLLRDDRDDRWLSCKRPLVIVGGELTLQSLDLQFDASTRYYQAPPHVKANGGVFVVDDLGRQLVAPRDLMNRWIVPLDRQRDFLSLHTGFRFAVPFDLNVIFSTNLRPDQLADDAFLRRFGYKVHLGAMDLVSYRRIFERVCDQLGAGFDATVFEWLVRERHEQEDRELLACHPRDLMERVRDFAIYENTQPSMTKESLDRAWRAYFFTAGADTSSRGPRHGVAHGNDRTQEGELQ